MTLDYTQLHTITIDNIEYVCQIIKYDTTTQLYTLSILGSETILTGVKEEDINDKGEQTK